MGRKKGILFTVLISFFATSYSMKFSKLDSLCRKFISPNYLSKKDSLRSQLIKLATEKPQYESYIKGTFYLDSALISNAKGKPCIRTN